MCIRDSDYPPQQKFFNESTSERFFVVSGGHGEEQHIDTHTRAEREREGVFGILRSPKLLLLLCSRRETTTLSEEEEERFVRVHPILDLCCAFVAVQWITT